MFCTRCGHDNPDDARFCAQCGAPLARVEYAASRTRPSIFQPGAFDEGPGDEAGEEARPARSTRCRRARRCWWSSAARTRAAGSCSTRT